MLLPRLSGILLTSVTNPPFAKQTCRQILQPEVFQDYLHGIQPYWKFWGAGSREVQQRNADECRK